jgi:hypothetical protein
MVLAKLENWATKERDSNMTNSICINSKVLFCGIINEEGILYIHSKNMGGVMTN